MTGSQSPPEKIERRAWVVRPHYAPCQTSHLKLQLSKKHSHLCRELMRLAAGFTVCGASRQRFFPRLISDTSRTLLYAGLAADVRTRRLLSLSFTCDHHRTVGVLWSSFHGGFATKREAALTFSFAPLRYRRSPDRLFSWDTRSDFTLTCFASPRATTLRRCLRRFRSSQMICETR